MKDEEMKDEEMKGETSRRIGHGEANPAPPKQQQPALIILWITKMLPH
mgnify:CR=1 FL=1